MQPPYISRSQSAELDRLMVARFKIPVTMMMEQAGSRIAELIRQEFPGAKRVLLCCGKGNNGGDGIAASRHLKNFGYHVVLFLLTEELQHEPRAYLAIARALGIPITTQGLADEITRADVLVDCLIGYNLQGEPRPPFDKIIEQLNGAGKPIVACDLPSGIDCNEGAVHEHAIDASHILFLSLPKVGGKALPARKFVADIGVPQELYPLIDVPSKNYFATQRILPL